MRTSERTKNFIKKYRHAWVLLYGLIYMPWFIYLERRTDVHYFLIHSRLDYYIPFIEYFIVPYLLWFAVVAVAAGYFFFTDKTGFYRLFAFLAIGMTFFLLLCTVFPNGLNLRPATFARDNIFVELVKHVYATDTPTNVLPSIHVFNSIGVCIAIGHSEALKRHRKIQYGSYLLAISIILSTVFLKQHSVTDVIAALVLACVVYPFVYAAQEKKATKLSHQPI